MATNLRLGYTVKLAFFLLSASALAIPTGQIQTKNKRQSGSISSSLKDSIEDAVDLDKHTKEKNDSEPNNNNNDRPSDRGQPSASASASASVSASTASVSNTVSGSGSSTSRSLTIAGGTIAGLVFLVLIGFFIYRWRACKKNNQEQWSNEKYPQICNHAYERQQDTPPPPPPPPRIPFGDKSSSAAHQRNETVTVMPKPPPLVLVLQGSKKVSEDSQTFFFENSSDRSSNLTLTTVYEEMRSPSQDSSISQTAPYPYRNPVVRKLYRSFQPPPIPESPEPMESRFSWTNNSVRTSVDSSPRFRTVTSWVDHQAGRLSVRAKLAEMQLGEEPSTPMEFGHHPGAPVKFLAQHQRLESADLDRQIMHAR